jgi:hypothetical protein
MFRFKVLKNIIVLASFMFIHCCSGKSPDLKAKGYVISFEEDAKSQKWAEYLYHHLQKRSKEPGAILILEKPNIAIPEGYKNIHFEVAEDLKNDYCISNTEKTLHIRTKSEKNALWIIYQLIENLSEVDNRFDSEDLPPATINFDSGCHDFEFDYREPYFEPNLQKDWAPIAGNNNVDTDWGLWGHNLYKIGDKLHDENIYALVGEKRDHSQFNFSSPELLKGVEDYIIDQYGNGDKGGYRFMIMPNDNNIVCTCAVCQELGNTTNNATPAVADFIRRLSERFPKHFFYTTAYKTTKQAPPFQFPKNSGVFFSTIDLKKGISLDSRDRNTEKFLSVLKAWQNATPNLYLWDYAANFDDYFTPMPILFGLQKQFQFFHKEGVKGMFLNGSGYNYMPFDDVKTYVAGALMMNAEVDIEVLCRKFFKKEYPISGDLLTDYYLRLEKNYLAKNKPYNMYGGMTDNLNTYFKAKDFLQFYDQLKKIIPSTRGNENEKLTKLYTALTYTRLQISYNNGANQNGFATQKNHKMFVKPEINDFLKGMMNYKEYRDMNSFKEEGGDLGEYITQWNKLLNNSSGYENQLLGTKVKVLSEKDEGFDNSDILTDGVAGFETNYHQGWYLSSNKDLHISFAVDKIHNTKKIKLRFLKMEKYGFFPPAKVEIFGDGNPLKSYNSTDFIDGAKTATLDLNLTFKGIKNIEMVFHRKDAKKSIIACDEIQVLN